MGKKNKQIGTPDYLDSIPTAIVRCTSRTVYYANKTAHQYFGKSRGFPVTLTDYFGEYAAREIRRIFRTKKNQGFVISINDRVFDVKKGYCPKNSNYRELLFNDVTDLHRNLEEEKKESGVFQTIVENSEDGISIVEGDRLIFVNQKFLELFGYSSEKQLIGKPFSVVVAPEDQKRVLSTSRARQEGQNPPFLYDYKGRKKNGRIIDIEVAASYIHFKGKPASLSFHRDVTERNALEMQLIESEEFRKNVFSSLEQGVIVFDDNLRCLDCNNQIEYFTGIDSREALGMRASEIFEKFKKNGVLEKFKNVLTGTKVSFGYLPYPHPISRQSRYAWLYLSPLLSSDGSVRGIVGVLSDLTHQKFMQDEIKESETMFRNVLEAMGDALVLTDLQGRVFRVNKEFERITGYREDEAIGQTIPYLWFYEHDTARFVLWISELRNKNYLHDFDIRWRSKSGDIIPVSLNTTLLKNKEGEPVAMLNIARDITDRKKLETELQNRNRDLTILASLGNIYASSLNIDEIADNVLERIKDLRQPDVLTISLLDKPAGGLRIVAAKGIPQEKLSYLYDANHPVIKKLFDNDDHAIIEDIDQESPELYDYFVRKDQRSVGFFLLKVENEILGILSVGFVNYNKFFPEDVALYRNIATQVTMAIQNAQLYQKIQNSEEKYRLLVEKAQDMVISLDLEGNFSYVSPSAKHLTGYDPEMILKQRFNPRMIHPGDYREINELMRLATAQQPLEEQLRALEFRIRTKSGNYRWMSASWTLMRDEQGRTTGVQCILHDVHERKLAEEEISQQLERLRVLYELAHELAATLDRNDILVTVSKSVTRVLPHLSFAIYLYDEETPHILQQILKFDAAAGTLIMDKPESIPLGEPAYRLERHAIEKRRLCDMQGDWKNNHKIVAPMIIKEKVLGLIALEADGTDYYSETHKDLFQTIAHLAGIAIEQALLYQETVAKSEEIQRRNRELDDFTYVVSHDLKEPLISIEGYSKILLADYSDALQEDGLEMLSSVSQSCNRMKNLINELLTLSRVGRLTESMSPVSIRDVVKEILEDLEYTIKKRKARVEVENNLPVVLGNRVHIVVLFRNLVVNGIKFNTSDPPVIEIGWGEEDEMYRFSVSDNGIGIEQESFDKIFTIFHRLRTDARFEGTGAGLTIVKKIVETHGGRIWLNSTVGEGTTFYFTLPKS